MKNAFIIHGAYTNPESDWYPWLKSELEKNGYTVYLPKFPTPEHQSFGEWSKVFEPYRQHINEESIFIGHSVGSAFVLHIIEETATPVRGIFLIAPFVEKLPHEGFNLVNATFVTTPFRWKTIHETMGQPFVFASNNDPYIPYEKSKDVADKLGAQFISVSGAGHFNTASEIQSVPNVLEEILSLESPKISRKEAAQELLTKELERVGFTGISLDPIKPKETPSEQLDDARFTKETNLPQFETYYQDISTTLTTADTKLMAEVLKEERENSEMEEKRKKRFLLNLIYGALAFVILLVGVWFIYRGQKPVELSNINEDLLIVTPYLRADNQLFFPLESNSVFNLKNSLKTIVQENTPRPGTISDIVPTQDVLGVNTIANPSQLFSTFEISLPGQFLSSLGKEYMYGFYGGDQTQGFILFTIDSFDGAFFGLEEWENSLVQDMQDILLYDPAIIRPSLYEQSFFETTLNNRLVRKVAAPTFSTNTYIETREERLPDPPGRHLLSEDIVNSIETITTTTIVFKEPDDFIRSLEIDDIIIAQKNDLHSGFLRAINGFSINDDGFFVIDTRTISAAEATVTAPKGNDIVTKIGPSGEREYYQIIEEEITDYIEGSSETVLLYTFLSNTELLITTSEQVLDEIIRRLASKERDFE